MKISEFKEGDIITRTARTDVKFGGIGIGFLGTTQTEPKGDGSYIGDKLRFLGIEAGSIWFQILTGIIADDKIHKMSMSDWDDDHWDFYPNDKIKYWESKYGQTKNNKNK